MPALTAVACNLPAGRRDMQVKECAVRRRGGEQTELGVEPVKGKGKLGQDPGPANEVNASGVVVAGGLVLRAGVKVALEVPAGEAASAVAVADNGLVAGVSLVTGTERSHPRTWSC